MRPGDDGHLRAVGRSSTAAWEVAWQVADAVPRPAALAALDPRDVASDAPRAAPPSAPQQELLDRPDATREPAAGQ